MVRLLVLVAVVITGGLGLTACLGEGDQENKSSRDPLLTAVEGRVLEGFRPPIAKLPMRRCETQSLREPAGHDIYVHGIGCGDVGLPPLTGAVFADKDRPAFFLSGNWACWQRLIDRGFTTDNVCWRGSRVVAAQFSG